MAAKKKKKASKKKSPSRAAKAKKTPARKAKKTAKKSVKKAKPAKKATKKSAARKPAKKAAKKKQIVGEGDYQASRTFLKDQSSFVKKNKSAIPAMGRDAGRALEGPEGDSLRQAEAEAASHSRDNLT